MATAARDVSIELGDRYFKLQQWRNAAEAYSQALREPGQAECREALIGLACALRFTETPALETLAAFEAARPSGLDDPQFWLVSVRFYLHSFARRDPDVVAACHGDRAFDALYRDALADIERGIETFHALVASRDRRCSVWAIALVRLADWMDAYIHPRRHDAGIETYPYRPHAARLYRILLESGVDTLLADEGHDIAGDIERQISGRARGQLELRSRPAARPANLPWYRDAGKVPFAWPLGILAILIMVMLVAELLAGSSILISAIDLALRSMPAGSARG